MKSRIAEKWSAANSGSFYTYNALKDQPNDWEIFNASIEDVNEAVERADKAWRSFRLSSIETRAKLLKGIASELARHAEELKEVYCLESNLSKERAASELNRTIVN